MKGKQSTCFVSLNMLCHSAQHVVLLTTYYLKSQQDEFLDVFCSRATMSTCTDGPMADSANSDSDSGSLSTSTEANDVEEPEADLPDIEFPKEAEVARPAVPDEDAAKGWDQSLDDESMMRMSRLAHREASW